MIDKPPNFKGFNIRIPIIIPVKGRELINQGSTNPKPYRAHYSSFHVHFHYPYIIPNMNPWVRPSTSSLEESKSAISVLKAAYRDKAKARFIGLIQGFRV